ncbi:MAG: hypothetical protein KatS3mg083_247 [Candidatus Dojkabacteria bacterium]|nr:MAG: hypothetical protein KatS3mg083_247 [Candidatus Dojkabacteria bacterium]
MEGGVPGGGDDKSEKKKESENQLPFNLLLPKSQFLNQPNQTGLGLFNTVAQGVANTSIGNVATNRSNLKKVNLKISDIPSEFRPKIDWASVIGWKVDDPQTEKRLSELIENAYNYGRSKDWFASKNLTPDEVIGDYLYDTGIVPMEKIPPDILYSLAKKGLMYPIDIAKARDKFIGGPEYKNRFQALLDTLYTRMYGNEYLNRAQKRNEILEDANKINFRVDWKSLINEKKGGELSKNMPDLAFKEKAILHAHEIGASDKLTPDESLAHYLYKNGYISLKKIPSDILLSLAEKGFLSDGDIQYAIDMGLGGRRI